MNDRSKDAIGKRLRSLRAALGLSQGDFAAETGLAQNTYCQFEKGERRPSLESAMMITDRFNVTLDWVYKGSIQHLPVQLLRDIEAQADKLKAG